MTLFHGKGKWLWGLQGTRKSLSFSTEAAYEWCKDIILLHCRWRQTMAMSDCYWPVVSTGQRSTEKLETIPPTCSGMQHRQALTCFEKHKSFPTIPDEKNTIVRMLVCWCPLYQELHGQPVYPCWLKFVLVILAKMCRKHTTVQVWVQDFYVFE